jgi:hypothetical protein
MNSLKRAAKFDCDQTGDALSGAACVFTMLAIFLIGFAGSSLRSHSTGKPFNFHAEGLKASLRQMLVFGPAMLLAFS